MTAEDAAARREAIGRAVERYDAAVSALRRAEALVRDCRETFRTAGGADRWSAQDGQVLMPLPVMWPSTQEIVEALETSERCRAEISQAREDLQKFGLEPSNWSDDS